MKHLNETIKKELKAFIEEMEVDVEELDSYHYCRNPYGVESALIGSSGCGEWDEDEEYKFQVEQLIDYIKADGIYEYCTIADDENEEQIQLEAINWLESLI